MKLPEQGDGWIVSLIASRGLSERARRWIQVDSEIIFRIATRARRRYLTEFLLVRNFSDERYRCNSPASVWRPEASAQSQASSWWRLKTSSNPEQSAQVHSSRRHQPARQIDVTLRCGRHGSWCSDKRIECARRDLRGHSVWVAET